MIYIQRSSWHWLYSGTLAAPVLQMKKSTKLENIHFCTFLWCDTCKKGTKHVSLDIKKKCIYIKPKMDYQSSMAKWLRRWDNPGVNTTTEQGHNINSHSQHEQDRVFFIQGRHFHSFPWLKIFLINSLPNKIISWPICSCVLS